MELKILRFVYTYTSKMGCCRKRKEGGKILLEITCAICMTENTRLDLFIYMYYQEELSAFNVFGDLVGNEFSIVSVLNLSCSFVLVKLSSFLLIILSSRLTNSHS